MNRFIAVLVLSLAAFSANCADPNRRDGNSWREFSPQARVDYLIGFLDGMDLGYHFSYWKYTVKSAPILTADSVSSKASSAYAEYSQRYFTNVRVGQLADGLNEFYSDYRNRSIRISDGVWVVVRQIAGDKPQDIEELITNLRRNASS